MSHTIRLGVCVLTILCVCFTLGIISFACDECQYMDHQRVILEKTNSFIKGYATTWYVSSNHTLVHGAGTYAWANSTTDYGIGGQRSTTATISGTGTVLGSHYESGNRSGCVCEMVWN